MSNIDNIVKLIGQYAKNNSAIIMTIATMSIGILAGWIPYLRSKLWKKVWTAALAVVFILVVHFAYGKRAITIIAIAASFVWLISSFLVFEKDRDAIRRHRLEKEIIRFTNNADREQPLCIFGGDLDFFGDVYPPIEEPMGWEKKLCQHINAFFKKRNDIEKNKQYKQIKQDSHGDCFSDIRILSIKPEGNTEKHKRARRRLGFLATQFGKTLKVKFFDEGQGDLCQGESKCRKCTSCPDATNCTHRIDTCEQLVSCCKDKRYNPDMKLRGRLIQKKNDDSMSAVIVSTFKPHAQYILKEYNNSTKEFSMYEKIWSVWWKKCSEDEEFIESCKKEYEEFIK